MAEVHRVVGPPGTGKTTWLQRQCQRAVDAYGSNSAIVVSLTRSAASEVAGRDTGLNEEMVGTLHSHAWRMIGMPDVAEDPKRMKEWCEKHPEFAFSTSADLADATVEQAGPAEARGDELMSRLNRLRHRKVDRSRWPEEVVDFEEAWNRHKAETSSIDFTDMIEMAIQSGKPAPYGARAIFADETQDFSALEFDLLKAWAASADSLIVVYDPAQSLYGWRGADPAWSSAEPNIVLRRSHRVPLKVQRQALSIVRNSRSYREAEYLPREDGGEGAVKMSPWMLSRPAEFVEDLDDPFAGPTMVLASCSYMLNSLVSEMKKRGVPYHNPYSPKRWNPLKRGTSTRRTATDRVLAWLDRSEKGRFSHDGVALLARSLKKATLVKGWEAALEDVELRDPADLERAVFGDQALDAAASGDLAWYVDALLSSHARSAEYPVAVARRSGPRLLREVASADHPTRGAVVVGTIHSVKGGEAERVIMFPDLSPSGWRSLKTPGWLHHDAVWRMMYVGATRARAELVIGSPSGLSVPIVYRGE